MVSVKSEATNSIQTQLRSACGLRCHTSIGAIVNHQGQRYNRDSNKQKRRKHRPPPSSNIPNHAPLAASDILNISCHIHQRPQCSPPNTITAGSTSISSSALSGSKTVLKDGQKTPRCIVLVFDLSFDPLRHTNFLRCFSQLCSFWRRFNSDLQILITGIVLLLHRRVLIEIHLLVGPFAACATAVDEVLADGAT